MVDGGPNESGNRKRNTSVCLTRMTRQLISLSADFGSNLCSRHKEAA